MGLMDYMTNETYRNASKEYRKANGKVNKLKGYRRDLEDDRGDINNIGRQVENIVENFSNAVRMSEVRGVVAERLRNIKEPIETADSDLVNAREYITREIRHLEGKMSNARRVMDGEKNTHGGGFR